MLFEHRQLRASPFGLQFSIAFIIQLKRKDYEYVK
jgi:hypothetical protein